MFKKSKKKNQAPWGEEGTYFSGMGQDFLHVSSSWALLMSLAYPEVEHPLNWFKLKSDLDPIEIRNLMSLYKIKSLSVDELFQRIFSTNLSYREFVEKSYEDMFSERFQVSTKMAEQLKVAKWSQEWEESLQKEEVNSFVEDCLGNLAGTKSTWAGFKWDSWDCNDWWCRHYLKASLIGFNAIASIFNQENGEFGWVASGINRDRIHGIACSLKLTATEPLEYLTSEMIETVERHCLVVAQDLRSQMKKEIKNIFDIRRFDETLFLAAKDGAKIAVIGIDPSSVECYLNGTRLAVSELPWFSEEFSIKNADLLEEI